MTDRLKTMSRVTIIESPMIHPQFHNTGWNVLAEYSGTATGEPFHLVWLCDPHNAPAYIVVPREFIRAVS